MTLPPRSFSVAVLHEDAACYYRQALMLAEQARDARGRVDEPAAWTKVTAVAALSQAASSLAVARCIDQAAPAPIRIIPGTS